MSRVAVLGATGRMGAALLAAIAGDTRLSLAAAITRPGHALVDTQAGDSTIRFRDDPSAALRNADFAVDFALPEGIGPRAQACRQAGCPWLVGSTGLDDHARQVLQEAARDIPVLHSANTSLAANACFAATAGLARVLGDAYDIDIIDLHHKGKRDAPSGTALEFGRVIAAARAADLADIVWRDDGQGERPTGTVVFNSVRAGRHAGEHRILFSGAGDDVELIHRVADRGIFARGALAAGLWLAGQPPGLYRMADFVAAIGSA